MKLVGCLIVTIILFMARPGWCMDKKVEKATFAGGCFWCMTPPFENTKGVVKVTAGYTGGTKENPTYEEVSSGVTGHMEAVEISYDPSQVSYQELLDVFWRNIDPTDEFGQFSDQGSQYKTAIFYHNEEQRALAQKSKKRLAESGKFKSPIMTQIIPASRFYPAEDYHQDYYKKNPVKYNIYKAGSGREGFIEKVWGAAKKDPPSPQTEKRYEKPSKEALKKKLMPLQYDVTQKCGTEPPFKNEYWNNEQEGIYVDVVSGEPLFSSNDKFDSNTGWPSFTKPLAPENIVQKKGLFDPRTEVKSKHAGSHLGHVFPDGPKPTGLRYCINSASLRFIPKEDLEKEGYGEYKKLFK